MADLAASDITITVEKKSIEGKRRRNRVKITFGDGALTYPAGGVPMPAAGKFGMKRNLEFLTIFDEDDGNGIYWKYDSANKKLRAYVQGYAHAAGGAATLDDYAITAGFGVKSGALVMLTSGEGAVTTQLGGLVEASGGAPAAQTLFAEAVGW